MIVRQDPKLLLQHQLESFYLLDVFKKKLGTNACGYDGMEVIENHIPYVLGKMERCFSYIKNKYYCSCGEPIFNPLHVCQWTMFLYEMAHSIYKTDPEHTDLCDMIYGISKCFSSADIFYGVNMPTIWFFDHPQGSVLGRAEYGNFFTFSQGCTVGNNKGAYPSIGEHVSMMSGSKILGKCCIGDHVILAANSFVMDRDIPSFSIVFGEGKDIYIKSIDQDKFNELTASFFDGDAKYED